MTAPDWRFRVSRGSGPDAPRATLAVTLRASAKGNTSARVTMPNGQRVRVVALHDLKADAIQRLGMRLAEKGWTIWHLSPPGEAMPEDGRPAMTTGLMDERNLPSITIHLQWLADHAPAGVVALGREAVLGGADAHVGTIHAGDRRWVSLTLLGASLSPSLTERLVAAGFSRDAVSGHARFYWTDAPRSAPRPTRPVPAPPTEAPTTTDRPTRGTLRLVPALPRTP